MSITAALLWAKTHWRTILEAIGAALALGGMAVLGFLLLTEKADNQHNQKVAERKIAALNLTIAEVRTRTAQAKADDLAHARTVEATNETIRQEKANDVQQSLAAELANTRAVNDRLRARAAQANPGGGGQPGLSGTGDASGYSALPGSASELDAQDRLICTENTVKLEGWQSWFSETLKVPQ